MNTKYIKYLTFLILIVVLGSCEKFEDIQPTNLLTEDNVVRDETSANAMLNRLYNLTRDWDITRISVALGWYGIEQDMTGNGISGAGADYLENNVQSDNSLLLQYYSHMYYIINNANFLIDQLEQGNAVGIGETRRVEILSEARTIRALSHFYLLRIFGQFYDMNSQYGIVVSTSPIRGKLELPRNTVQEAYSAIVEDLEYAANNGPSGKQSVYLNAIASRGFLAKVQLYMGNYDQAASNALAVINNGEGFELDPSFGNIFTGQWESPEILYCPYVDDLNESDASTDFFGSSECFPSAYLITLFDDSDGVAGDGDSEDIVSGGFDSRFIYAYDPATSGSWENGKYPQNQNTQDESGNTYYYLRMAEIYLIYAESEARRSGGNSDDALVKLNEVRSRGDVTMPPKMFSDLTTLLHDIRQEKMMELFTETGEPWFDLVRADRLGDIDASILKPTLNTVDKFIFPLPEGALLGNKLLVQNP